LQMERNEAEAAAAYLEQVVSGGSSKELRTIAGLRLALVRLHQQQYDEALAVLENIDPNSSFSARGNEVRGDIYYEQGRFAESRAEYEAALADQQTGVVERSFVQAKLDGVPVAEVAAEVPADPVSNDTVTSQIDSVE